MTRFDLLKRTNAPLAASLILMLAREYPDEDILASHLQGEVSEAELQQINAAAQRENTIPPSLSDLIEDFLNS